MACASCQDLCVEFRIAHPSQLQKAISVAGANLADGTLAEVTPPQPSYSQQSFAQLASGGAWDDVFQYNFICTHCQEQFTLSAETYHGSGGAWQVAKESSRVAL